MVPTCLAERLWLLLACVVLSGSFPAVSGLYLLGCAFLAVARLLCPFSGSLLIFPYRAPPRNQKPRKNHGFLLSPTKKIGIGRGYETPFFCDFTHTHETPQIAMTFWHPLPLLLLGSADNGHVISQEFEGWVFCVRRSSPVMLEAPTPGFAHIPFLATSTHVHISLGFIWVYWFRVLGSRLCFSETNGG